MTIRTYGLSGSGIDVDQMVKDLMKARRTSYDTMWQKKTQAEWQKKDYNSMYSLVEEFRNSTVFNFRMTSSLQPKLVTSSNDSILTATANADAANVSHSVKVNQLADGVKLSSSAGINGSGTLVDQFGYTAGSTLDFKINGQAVSIEITDTTSLYDVVSAINKTDAKVKANYDSTLDRFYLYSNKTGSESQVDFSGSSESGLDFIFNKLKLGTVSTQGMASNDKLGLDAEDYTDKSVGEAFGISGDFSIDITTASGKQTFTVDGETTSLSDIVDAINTYAGSQVASYDAETQKLTLKADEASGVFNISSSDAAGQDFLVNQLKLTAYGQDSKINIDGVDVTQSSNNFTLSGVTYNLKSVSSTAANISIQADIDKTIENVKAFVDSYNTMIGAINTELNEDKYRDFLPLTDDQKADMEDGDIEAWQTKAHSGLLRNDSILSELINGMRSAFSSPISGLAGDYRSASAIGITTGKYIDDDGNITTESDNGGKLYVDEEDLRKALTEDPDIVYKIFGTIGDTKATEGVANRLNDQMYSTLDKLKDKAGVPGATDTNSFLAKRLEDYTDSLDALEDRLDDMEERYYRQFDAMEVALNSLNQQSSWLMEQFSS